MDGQEWQNDCEPSSPFSEDSIQEFRDHDEKANPFIQTVSSVSRLQFRKHASKACWNESMCMAEVTEKKGSTWTTTGIVYNGKIYLFLEETLSLANIGALLVFDPTGSPLSTKDMIRKLAEAKNGCCFKSFMVYKRLKTLGYVVGRHGVPWIVKGNCTVQNALSTHMSCEYCSSKLGARNNNGFTEESEKQTSITTLLSGLHMDEVDPIFDVYLPNKKFRKSSPGLPNFLLCLFRDATPSIQKICVLERHPGSVIKLAYVANNGRVVFFSCKGADLPVLA